MSDLILNVRQISNYPELTQSDGSETLLVQQGGLGGPYASIGVQALVSTGLGDDGSMSVGTGLPVGVGGGNIFAELYVMPLGESLVWNAYGAADATLRYWNNGVMGGLSFSEVGYVLDIAPSGGAGQVVVPGSATPLFVLSQAGAMELPHGTLTVARDPAASNEVATLNYVSNNTVQSFNQRQGQVTLNAADVYSALKLCDPLATQPWVNQAITASLQNLLYTCPFVNTWNGRQGQVYLMLSDITCVFFQSGQQPISPTPPAGSDDNSIATTQWVTAALEGSAAFLPISGGTMLGPLNYTATNAMTSRSAQDRAAEVINVKDYGAIGDGATDDTAAIQAALNAITLDGGAVYFPGGNYSIAQTLTIPTTGLSPNGLWAGIRLYGDGTGFTRLTTGMTTTPFMTCMVPSGQTMWNLTIEGIFFQTYSMSFDAWHIDIQNVHAFTLRRCSLMSQNTSLAAIAGVRVSGVGLAGPIYYAFIDNSSISGGTVQFSNLTDCLIINSTLQAITPASDGTRASSIHLTGSGTGDIRIISNHLYSAPSGAIFVDAASSGIMVVEGNMFDTNPPNDTAVGINITTPGNTWTIANNVFNVIPASTIICNDLTDSAITGNMFTACGQLSGTASTIVFNGITTGCAGITVANNGAIITDALPTPLNFIQENANGAHSNTYLGNQVSGLGYKAQPYEIWVGSLSSVAFPTGINFDNAVVATATDVTRHINLANGYGFSASANQLNIVVPTGQTTVFYNGTTAVGACFPAGLWSVGLQSDGGMGLFGSAVVAVRPTVTGSAGGNAALDSLLTALANYGLIINNATP